MKVDLEKIGHEIAKHQPECEYGNFYTCDPDACYCRKGARAAYAAIAEMMREPTSAMLNAGAASDRVFMQLEDVHIRLRKAWRAMLGAAEEE